jgi:hypothetical protein
VKTWFQAFAFHKCNLYRYSAAAQAYALGVTTARDEPVAEVKGGGRFTCMAVMPSALPSTIAEAVLTERAPLDPAEAAAKRKVGLCVASHDAHWPALYREPMTCDFVSSPSNWCRCL